MARVSIEGLAKQHGDVKVLEDVSLEIADGELLVLVGPSGCGKSTLLRCIAGLEEPTRGKIRIDGDDVTAREPRARDLAMVFQSYALYPHLTVRENLAFGLKMRKTPKPEIAVRVAEAAAMLGLDALLDRLPRALSGGQRQRVAMGRAVVRRPKAFLFDEPLSNLDAALRGQMRVELMRLHQRLGATMIYVTHDQVEAMTLADRIAVLQGGRLQQVGAPDELYRRPANLFVARFIGMPEMNVLPPGLFADGSAYIGVRAEDVKLDTEGVAARVEVIEHLGADALVHLSVEGKSMVARVESARAPKLGDTVKIAVDAARVHRFDSDGKRL